MAEHSLSDIGRELDEAYRVADELDSNHARWIVQKLADRLGVPVNYPPDHEPNNRLREQLIEARDEVEAMARRAEAAEGDWQVVERRVTLLEAVVKEARAHIRNLLDYPERTYGVDAWLTELPDRLEADR